MKIRTNLTAILLTVIMTGISYGQNNFIKGLPEIHFGDSKDKVTKEMKKHKDIKKGSQTENNGESVIDYKNGTYLGKNIYEWKFSFYKNKLYGISVEYDFTEKDFSDESDKAFNEVIEEYGAPDNNEKGMQFYMWTAINGENKYMVMLHRSLFNKNHLKFSVAASNLMPKLK